jgi:23S rRNA pseudouridine2605 synthase
VGHAEPERLQKVLARAGLASRREVEDWIRAARITVNGKVAVLGERAGPADEVRLDGRIVRQREADGGGSVFICHRSPGENLRQPVGDDAGETPGDTDTGAAMIERLPRRSGRRFIPVSPMPRIDGGLELVTSDGELAARLQRTVRRLSSEFSVRVMGELGPEQVARILQGTLDRGETLAVSRCEAAGGEGANRWYALEARGASGKDVRQLFERQGAMISRVLRTRLGSLALERTLARGRFRPLTVEELTSLMESPAPGS